MLKIPGDEAACVLDEPKAIAHHRLDGFAYGEVPPFRNVWHGLVDDVAHAECVEQASHALESLCDVAGLLPLDWATARMYAAPVVVSLKSCSAWR